MRIMTIQQKVSCALSFTSPEDVSVITDNFLIKNSFGDAEAPQIKDTDDLIMKLWTEEDFEARKAQPDVSTTDYWGDEHEGCLYMNKGCIF